ncbi:sulfite exporter TauE/SafE family protein [Asaia lannensis]|uniref:Probable membrane transporter protein n=1 Tax=Asaia lannensis NBRC 102526 TaxID=1307926 RepID=A0ABT1CHI4_9PROT|nr:sulfite exporter TauE/SafE family protein [Asaia lannensis]MCO6160191.1 sulfite exporter TauE/SafE family protein [Asaia lannensis NBRC 102526]GBQ99815.1 hypothetical protein AA102526_1940 [Asaia lannensis NBRC 102526]
MLTAFAHTPFASASLGPALASGSLVGLVLGLIGGGGSILAVPLLIYFVGVRNPHVAIGTSAFAVAVNALAGLFTHAREHTVKWRCAGFFAPAGMLGAALGAQLGKAMDGQRLLLLFAGLMVLIGIAMIRGRHDEGIPGAACNRDNVWKVGLFGLCTGGLSGFFGIGGGFLIVPALMAATHMPVLNAVGTSLVAVAAFGVTTSVSYAFSGLVDWSLAGWFIAGGIAGCLIGTRLARQLGKGSGATLKLVFAGLIFVVAGYIVFKTL